MENLNDKKLNEAVNDILGIDNQSEDKTFENESYEVISKFQTFKNSTNA